VSRLLGLCCALGVAGGVACTTPEETEVCPSVGVGDLVVTELRGNQAGTFGQYIELYNASAGALELRGLHVRLRNVTGSADDDIIVRRSLTVAPGDQIVLGGFPAASPPAHVDYGWQPDFLNDSGDPKSLPDSGDIRLEACGVLIDRVVWTDLPDAGTYSLGLAPPDAAGNDAAGAWCTDATDDTDPVTTGLPGTPGASNHPCP
jgi:hypothetical protein